MGKKEKNTEPFQHQSAKSFCSKYVLNFGVSFNKTCTIRKSVVLPNVKHE